MGGYKQPQQLIALNYVLALGHSFDMVLNLDGFNDIVLAPKGQPGLSPFYPTGWPNRIADLPDVEAKRLVGEIAYLEYRRMQMVDWCSGAPLSFSPSCYLAWRLANRRAAARIGHIRKAFLNRPQERGFLTHGPEGADATTEKLLRDLAGFWGRSSFQMHSICEGLGIPYFHFLQPNQYVPNSKSLTRREKLIAFDPRQPWGQAVPKGYPHLIEAGERLVAAGVSFHDMRMVFANVETTVYSDPCCHLNQEGSDRLAAAMAHIIIRELEVGQALPADSAVPADSAASKPGMNRQAEPALPTDAIFHRLHPRFPRCSRIPSASNTRGDMNNPNRAHTTLDVPSDESSTTPRRADSGHSRASPD